MRRTFIFTLIKGNTMQSNFTPGPWRAELALTFDGRAAGSYDVLSDDERRGRFICETQSKADAALIAAAPAMLAALREALELLNDPDADGFQASRVEYLIESAIRLATEGSP